MTDVLVTGGTGVLGRHLVPLLRDAGHDVRVLSRQARPRVPDGVAAVQGALADGSGVPRAVAGCGVVVHCVAGKDRTGLLTAFLLHVAGVDTDAIAADYALSEERLRPRHEESLAAAVTDEERERLRRIAQTPAAAIVGVFDELERRYGSVTAYLRAAGCSDDDLAAARARLLDAE